jgi:outer membrane protein assembly factor BamD
MTRSFSNSPQFVRKASGLVVMTFAAIVLAGCSSGSLLGGMLGNDDRSTVGAKAGGAVSPDLSAPGEGAVAALYNEGLSELQGGNYKKATKKFSEVERQHPYSKWATKAILMQAFASYQRNAYDEAILAGKRFVTLHPGHKDAPYAYYLIAISQYEQIADVRRDQSRTEQAVEALEEVARRYPDSPYAADALKKAAVGKDQLAAKEMEVGRYYMKQGSYLAGINRFRKVVTDYQTSTQTPEALYRLAEGYMALGVQSEAQTAAAVLGHNYPGSEWYKDAYSLVSTDGRAPQVNQKSWIAKVFGA